MASAWRSASQASRTCVAVGVVALLRLARRRLAIDSLVLARTAPAYVIGGSAAFWLIERIFAV